MSTAKQELAAILMDYADKISDQVYIDILNRVGEYLIISIHVKQEKFKKNLI